MGGSTKNAGGGWDSTQETSEWERRTQATRAVEGGEKHKLGERKREPTTKWWRNTKERVRDSTPKTGEGENGRAFGAGEPKKLERRTPDISKRNPRNWEHENSSNGRRVNARYCEGTRNARGCEEMKKERRRKRKVERREEEGTKQWKFTKIK